MVSSVKGTGLSGGWFLTQALTAKPEGLCCINRECAHRSRLREGLGVSPVHSEAAQSVEEKGTGGCAGHGTVWAKAQEPGKLGICWGAGCENRDSCGGSWLHSAWRNRLILQARNLKKNSLTVEGPPS